MTTALAAGFRPFSVAHARQPRGAKAAASPSARLGGGGSGGNDPRNQRSGLILPGQETSARGGSLFVPGQGGGAPSSGGLTLGGGSGGSGAGAPPAQQNFRPPPGFMNAVDPGQVDEEVSGLSTEEMLARLRSLTGYWHELAKYLPALQRAGFDGLAVEEATGLERKTQNVWNTASQVYESIKAPGLLPPGALERFNEDGEYLLYELRFLSIKQRAPVAAYVAENGFSPFDSQVLARAVKDYERRGGQQEGFSNSPGDVLAYKFFRDAQECRRKEDVESYAKRGLAAATTEEARAKLAGLYTAEGDGPVLTLPTAILTTLRVARDELGFRPLAVAGDLQTATADQVMAAPKVSSEGVFGNFKVPADGIQHEWVALPNWSVLTLARHPIALRIEDCAKVPRLRNTSAAKTEDELRKLSGLGVLVADIKPDPDRVIKPTQYYLIADAEGRIDLAPGEEAERAARVLGHIICLCRPPTRDTAANSTSELLSL